MVRVSAAHRCTECGAHSARWSGRCGACGAWNALEPDPDRPAAASSGEPSHPPEPARRADELLAAPVQVWPSGVDELDRVLGGGFVPGSTTLVGGEPGIGKSTLLLQALGGMTRAGRRCLLVSAEESAGQVGKRAQRIGAGSGDLWLTEEAGVQAILALVDELDPAVVVVDSVQAVSLPGLGSGAGSVLQVRESAQALCAAARRAGRVLVLVGQVTKDGSIAGPRVLEHLVDTVLSFEGERHHALRLLRAVKHRFGATGELGLFEMDESGLRGIADPSGLLLEDRRAGVPGSVVVPALEGRRPLLVEVQALVAGSDLAQPRRSAQGLDPGRLALLLAVLERRLRLRLGGREVFASAVGGVRVTEPAADLAVALALASSVNGRPLPADLVACGEVGLAGEVRQVSQLGRRLGEAARLGFRRAVVPCSSPPGPAGLELVRVAGLDEAVRQLGLGPT